MKRHVVTVLVASGCTATQDPYAVDAIAQLAPVGTPDVRITGPIEILGTGVPDTQMSFGRTVAAYHVQLPDGAAPWVRLYIAASCTPEAAAILYEDLGTIRQVGDEAHFFARNIRIGDRTLDVDIETVAADVALDNSQASVFTMIAVVQAPGDGTTLEPSLHGQLPAGGPWLACGTFVAP